MLTNNQAALIAAVIYDNSVKGVTIEKVLERTNMFAVELDRLDAEAEARVVFPDGQVHGTGALDPGDEA